METTNKKGKGHGHPWIVGVIGLFAALLVYLHFPKYKILNETVMLFSMAHIIIGGILVISTYLITPKKWIYELFDKKRIRKQAGKFYFGWSYGWMNLYWIAGIVFLTASVWVYLINPHLIWLTIVLLLISLNLWAGNFVLRASKNMDYMTLPMVDLFPAGKGMVLDAGCGAGRTTLALQKNMKPEKIIALDRFDSDYIVDGGRSLLERNLNIAGISRMVEVHQGDITALEFAEQTFDAAISSFMMDHLGKYKLDALQEVNRVLRPGGRFLLIVFVPNYATFSVFNLFSFSLTSRKGWRNLFTASNFKLVDEGIINSAVYFLIEKPCGPYL